MTCRRVTGFAAVAIFAIVVGFWFGWTRSPPDVSRVEPRLAALRAPFLKVQTYHWQDGGTIGIEIVDAEGAE